MPQEKKAERIISAIVKKYAIDIESPPDITDSGISSDADEAIAEECRPIMEGGPINLYKDQSCKAELVLDATANKNEDTSIYMRIENTLIFEGIEETYDNEPCTFKQFTHNLGER